LGKESRLVFPNVLLKLCFEALNEFLIAFEAPLDYDQ